MTYGKQIADEFYSRAPQYRTKIYLAKDVDTAINGRWRKLTDEYPLAGSTVIVKMENGTLVSCEYQEGYFYSLPAALIMRAPVEWLYWGDL